jgi:hypothetical protein
MSTALYPVGRPAAIAEVLDAGFRIFRSTLLQTLPYGLLAMLAGKLPHLYQLGAHASGRAVSNPLWWGLDVAAGVLVIVFGNAIVSRQSARADGMTTGLRADLLRGLRLAPETAVLLTLLVAAVGVWFTALLLTPSGHTTAATSLAAIPAIYFAVISPNVWLALVADGHGVPGSLAHGWKLVRGHWWRCFTIYLIGLAVLAVFMALAGVIAGLIIALAGSSNLAVMTALSAESAVAIAAVALPFYCALALAVYRDLAAWHRTLEGISAVAGQLPVQT